MGIEFRTIERSNPQYGIDNLQFVTVKSRHLHGRGDICFYKPKGCPTGVSVVILLHGVYGSAWSWPLSSGVHEQVDAAIGKGELKPMILAMPSDGLWGDGSGYVPHESQDFEKWIVEDVVNACKSIFADCVDESSKFFIAGLSMGGYGAMRLGSKYPGIFTAFSGLSSITSISEFGYFVEEDLNAYELSGDLNVLDLIVGNSAEELVFRFDCGKDDLLIEYNRNLHKKLKEMGITHVFEEFEGGHSWDYWKNNIMKTLLFFNLQV